MTQPRDELNRFQKTLRFGYDLGRYGARQLREGRAAQMAAALAFRALFGLMPVLVVGTVLARTLMGPDEFRRIIKEVFQWTGLYEIEITLSTSSTAETDPLISLGEFLDLLVGQAARLNLAAVGWLGLAVLIYSAIGLMVTIENSFNSIYGAPQGRSWTRRVPLYWFVLTVGPVAIGLTMYIDKLFDAWIGSVEAWHWLLISAPIVWGFVTSWMFLFAVYTLVPNTHVALRPALVGAFVAAILLEIGKQTLGAYLGHALSIRQLYGSLGLIPLFMFWVYLMWLMVLFGLQVSATLQMLGGRNLAEIDRKRQPTGIVDPTSVLVIMQVVAEQFQTAQPTTARRIADATSISEATIVRMLDSLVGAGFLHRLDQEDGAVALARPPDQVSADELIEIGFRLVDEGRVGLRSGLVQRLREAQKSLAGQVTLAALAASGAPAAVSGQATAD
jgi:membrane protein